MKRLMSAVAALVTVSSVALFASEVNLIEPEEAIKLIGDKNVIFISGDDEDAYKNNHIAGSIEMYAHHLHHSDKMGNMHCAPLYQCPKEAQEHIREKGIRNDQLIIAYDNFRGPNATGVYSFFESFGHKNIKLLNGGFDGVKAIDPNQKIYDQHKAERKEFKDKAKEAKKAGDEKLATELEAKAKEAKAKMDEFQPKLLIQPGEEPKHEHSEYVLNPDQFEYSYIADKNEVKTAMEDILKNGEKSKFVIIDTRGMDEIIGEKKMDNVARGGHIPGSKLIEWKNFTDFDKKKSFKSLPEMQKVFDQTGVTKDQTIYAYCMVGAGRGSDIITALRLLGYENVKVFTGSWDTWGNDMNLPIRR